MAAGAARAAKPRRKRARKTRTAIVSDASSSSSPESSSSSSSDEEPGPAFGRAEKVATTTTGSDSQADSDSDSSSSGELSSSSSSSSQAFETSRGGQSRNVEGRWNTRVREAQSLPPEIKQDFSDSSEDEGHEKVTLDSQCRKLQPPTPVLRSEIVEEAAQKRQEGLRIKNEKKAAILAQQRQTAGDSMTREEEFQAMWMRMMVDGFGEELDALRKKEPNLAAEGGNRMPLLIDALQAGSEVFSRGTSASAAGRGGRESLESDEVGLMLWRNEKAS